MAQTQKELPELQRAPPPSNVDATNEVQNGDEKKAGGNKVYPETNGDVKVTVKDKDGETVVDSKEEELNKSKTNGEKEKGDEKKEVPMVGLGELFRFADGKDRALIVMGIIAACFHGAATPVMIIVFGEIMDTFVGNDQFLSFWTIYGANITATYNLTAADLAANTTTLSNVCNGLNLGSVCSTILLGNEGTFYTALNMQIVYFVLIGLGTFLISALELLGFEVSAVRQTQRVRTSLFRCILRQDISWFDMTEVGELNSRLADDVGKIEQGVGEKMGNFFQYLCAALVGFIVAMVYGWKLTLVVLAASPLVAIGSFLLAKVMSSLTGKELSAYAKAGAVAEEVLGAFRTVTAFSGQEKECERYNENLVEAKKKGVLKGILSGVTVGFTYFIFFCTYALAFWYGSVLVREDAAYTVGRMLIVFFCVIIGASSLGNAAPSIQYLSTARGAAQTVYSIIDQKPIIDSSNKGGLKPESLTGNIEFKGVTFHYPSRPEIPILNGLDLEIKVGQTVALVGASGCGKSTTVQLIQRFYDTIKGAVMIDDIDVRELNVQWLREHIGVVSQEPILFATTIGENILYGREGVTQAEIETAARNANAHDFISKLPDKYDTMVGERGAQLSGGQKQRIAIARALVRDPKILLLDEATSALDTTSEAIVQSALDKARQGRTTIVIAHRLSTIKTADVIAGFDKGEIVEKGTHDELMQMEGVYHTLVMNQTNAKDDEDGDNEDKKSEADFIEDALPAVPQGLKRQKSAVGMTNSTAAHSTEIEDEKEKDKEVDGKDVPLSRIVKLNQSECVYIILGCIGSMIGGAIQPVFGFIFSTVISVFTVVDPVQQEATSTLYSLLFIGLGGAALIGNFLQEAGLSVSGETLTMRMRQMAFKALLRQEVAWFDKPEHNTGALTTRLATDASTVKGATGSQLATVLRAITAVGLGLGIGFYYSWALTLVILAMGPIIFLSGFVRMKIVQGSKNKREKQAMEDAGQVAVESIENIRTVASLSKEMHFYEKYCDLTGVPYNRKMKRMIADAVAYGFSQGVQFLINAAVFGFGAYLIKNHGLSFDSMFKVFAAVVFTAMAVGQSSSFAPDYAKAKLAAARIFAIIDREPPIDSYSTEGKTPSEVTGVVQISAVHFNYPNRPDVKVLRGLSVEVRPGQTLALVGSSGCGKSTSIQLMERFYDPDNGDLKLDGTSLRDLNITWLRSQISLVSQEPILFDCSIRENIEYGDLSREITMDEVISATRQANIHEFIASLPEGYETNVGDKGAQLSGGQKQRIAIARALIRDPKILLLDEATSALDTESEKVVQEALDRAREGRTCIVIAHRLSTIRNADAIAVIHNGQVAELGTHSELMFREGLYYKLNNAQNILT